VFLLYTDGVVESASGSGEQFGQSRMKDLLMSSRDRSPAQLCEALVRETESFRGGKGAVDDLTVVAVRVG